MSNVSGFDIPLRLFRIMVLRKKLILFIALAPTLICLIVVMVSKSTYVAEALIKPPSSDNSSPLEAAFKESGAGSLLGSFMGGAGTGENDCISIFKSVLFERLIIERFDLETVWELKKDGKPKGKIYFADVAKQFQRYAGIELTEENAIRITMRDESPERARDIVSFMIRTLDSLYTDIQRTATPRRLEYVDRRLAMPEAEMKGTEDSLVAFQNRHNLIVPEAQVKLILENATQTELQVETLKEQLALEAALRGTSSAKYQDLMTQKNLMQQALQGQLRSHADSNSLILPARTLPALANEYFRYQRAYTVRLGVYKYLVQQVEALKLEANKNVQVISVIDPPWNNDKRVSPKRRVMLETTLILSFILALVVAVLKTKWEKYREENPESLTLVMEIKKNLLKF